MSDSGGRAFWLCHECGAQMRPIRIDGVRQCASCNSEFIEILDPDVNPDPSYELPPQPPTRPGVPALSIAHHRPSSPYDAQPPGGGGGLPGMLGSMISGFFGGGGQAGDQQAHPHANQQDTQATAGGSGNDGPFGRTYQFNIGGGSGSVTFGSFGGGGGGGQGGGRGGMGGFGPFGPVPGPSGDQGGGLDAFFPGFPPAPPQHRQGQGRTTGSPQTEGPMQPPDLFRVLMGILSDEGVMQGPQGRMNIGDYVATEHGFDQILEQLMHATGPQGPIPATDAVIEGLPRFKLDEAGIAKSTFKDCPVCKDDYEPGDEVMRVPCEHIFHVDCLQPWLKTNGSCPVCRFSLIPDDSNRQPRSTNPPGPSTGTTSAPVQMTPLDAPGSIGNTPITDILQRLWGTSGSTSQVASPTTENPPTPPVQPNAGPSQPQRLYDPPTTPPPGAASNQQAESEEIFYTPPSYPPPSATSGDQSSRQSQVPTPAEERLPTAIPDDYRERHRQREREQSRQQDTDPYVDELD